MSNERFLKTFLSYKIKSNHASNLRETFEEEHNWEVDRWAEEPEAEKAASLKKLKTVEYSIDLVDLRQSDESDLLYTKSLEDCSEGRNQRTKNFWRVQPDGVRANWVFNLLPNLPDPGLVDWRIVPELICSLEDYRNGHLCVRDHLSRTKEACRGKSARFDAYVE